MAESGRNRSWALAVPAGLLLAAGAWGATAAAAPVCRTTSASWNPPSTVVLTTGGTRTYDTGVNIPVPGPGETLRVTGSSYTSYDRYPAGTSPSRADAAQLHEQWGLRIGGVDFGLLTGDVPDSPAQGAADDWYGAASGSLGSAAAPGGRVVIVHASQYGYTESPNSVRPSGFSLSLEYCSEVAATTTTVAPTTVTPTTVTPTTIAPTTSVAPTTAAPTTTVAPTTSVDSTVTTSSVDSTSTSILPLPVPTSVSPTSVVATTQPTSPASSTTVDASTSTSILPLTPLPASTVVATTTPGTPATAASTTIVPRGPLPVTGWAGAVFLQAGAVLVAVGGVLYRLRRREAPTG